MNARELRISEAYGRARKAAHLSIVLTHHIPALKDQLEALADGPVREDLGKLCGYGHVSDDTWEMVREMLKEAARHVVNGKLIPDTD